MNKLLSNRSMFKQLNRSSYNISRIVSEQEWESS